MAGRERVVEFAVKARDEYSKVLKNLEQQQNKLSAAAKASQRRATVGVAQGEVDAALANYKRLTAEVDRYNKALNDGRTSNRLAGAELDELAATIKLTRDRAREAADAYQQKQTALRALTGSVNTGYGAIDRLASSTNRVTVETMEEGVAASETAAQLNKLTAASKAAAGAQGTLKTRTDAANTSIRRQRSGGGAKGNAQDVEVFGLKPWQLTNLGYQVNDVVSGLAMGQRPLQILSQQAGQFAQIWPNAMVALARSIPIIAAVTAVIAPFAVAAKRLYDTNESIRVFSADLALSADGANYSAEQLAKATDAMREFGLSTSDARDVVRQFVKDGIKQSDFSQIAKMAKELDAITGEGVGAAAKRLSGVFSGSVDDVRKLDQELNFLTADQLESITATAKAGDTAGALSQAQSILAGRLAATKGATSDWGQAIKDLTSAWNTLIGVVQNSSVFKYMMRQVRLFGEDAKAVAGVIKDAADAIGPGSTLESAQKKLAEINQAIATEQALRASGVGSGSPGMSGEDPLETLQAQRRELEALVQNVNEGTNAFEKMGAAQADNGHQSVADQKAVDDVLSSQNEKLAEEERLAKLTNRQRFIEQQALEAKNKLLEKGLEWNDKTLDSIRKQAAATYDAQNPNYEAQYTALRGTPQGTDMARLVSSVSELAVQLKVNAKDLLTAISYETGGTFNPAIKGGAGGKYAGLFQFSPYNQQKYGINETSSIEAQTKAALKYLTDAGVKAGDGLLQIYAAINAGNAKNIHASDEKNGGAPGTVLDKVSEQMDQHAQKAQALIDAFDGSLAQKQAQYNEDLNDRLTTAQQELDLAKRTNREAAIAKAVRDEELKAKKDGLTVSDEQLAKVKAIAAAEFDQAHANDEVNRLVAQRTALFESLQIAQEAGDQGKVASVVEQISNVEDKLKSAIDSAIKFWQAMGGPNADQAIADLENLRDSIGQTLAKMDKQFLPTAQNINEQLADSGANAFDAFARAIANGENSAKALFAALRQGIAEFLIDIGKAIIKQAIFNAISGASGSGGIGGSISSFITGLFRHDGGLAGSGGGRTAMFNPAVFANATRFHNGGIAGLKPNEVPIVALKDEEILTSDDPRHRANGGLNGGQPVNLKNINVFDPADLMEAALQTLPGERVLMNWLTRNKQKVSAAISG